MSIVPNAVKAQWARDRHYAEERAYEDRDEIVRAARAAYAFKEALRELHKSAQIPGVKLATLDGIDALDALVDEHLGSAAMAAETYAANEADIDIEGKVQGAVTLAYADTPEKEDVQ